MAAQPGRAPAAGARRLPQHDGARRAPTLARRPRHLLRTGVVQPTGLRGSSHPRAPLGCAAVNPPPAPPAPPGTIVVALGGNAVAPPGERPTISDQFRHTRASLAPIVDLAREGWRIALVHGNGPQVGDELARNEIAADQVEPLPLGVLVAATAGWMGYMIQQSLQNALARAGVTRQVVTLLTHTLCDPHDPNLRSPTKPIGHAPH